MYVCVIVVNVFFLMIRRPPSATRTDTLFPYTSLFRSLYSAAAAFAPRNLQRLFADIDRPRAGRGRLCVAGGAILCAPARPKHSMGADFCRAVLRHLGNAGLDRGLLVRKFGPVGGFPDFPDHTGPFSVGLVLFVPYRSAIRPGGCALERKEQTSRR